MSNSTDPFTIAAYASQLLGRSDPLPGHAARGLCIPGVGKSKRRPRKKPGVLFKRSSAMTGKCWTGNVKASTPFPYKAENIGLGTLEKLPAELRLMIFEIVLEVDRKITTRTCCGPLSGKYVYCAFHQPFERKGQTFDRTRFALMHVSRAVNKAITWIMHNKIKVRADASTLMLTRKKELGLVPRGRTDFNHMRSISRFRHLEFTFSALAADYMWNDHIDSLLDILRQLTKHWQTEDKTGPAELTCNVVIHLGTLFTKRPLRERTARLEKMVELMAMNEHGVKWTITAAVSDIPLKHGETQYCLDMFKTLLKIFDIEFQETTADNDSVLDAVESRGVMGGTHRRFLD